MNPVDHSKTKQLIIDLSRRLKKSDNLFLLCSMLKNKDIWRPMKNQNNLDLQSPIIWVLLGNKWI